MTEFATNEWEKRRAALLEGLPADVPPEAAKAWLEGAKAAACSYLNGRGVEAADQNLNRLLLDFPFDLFLSTERELLPDNIDAHKAGDALGRVALHSDYLTEALSSDPSCAALLVDAILNDGGECAEPMTRVDLEVALRLMQHEVPDDLSKEKQAEALHVAMARFKRMTHVRTGLADLLGLRDIVGMMRDLSVVADAIVEWTYYHFWNQLTEEFGLPKAEVPDDSRSNQLTEISHSSADDEFVPFCVVSMGKGGGQELNFSSDIDLIFVYGAEGETTGVPETSQEPQRLIRKIPNHEFFKKLAEQISGFLSKPGVCGAIYRVDLRLRPDGNHGPLARSLGSFRAYFAEQALGWERVAYAKSRAIAGVREFNVQVEKTFHDFAYSEIFNTEILPEMHALKQRIDRQGAQKAKQGVDLKRSRGGIRDIEFLLIALQLLYANDVPELRTRRSTLGALDALNQSGLMDRDAINSLRRDYLLLRRLEQRIQLIANRQTHLLVTRGPQAEVVAQRVWGCSSSELQKIWEGIRTQVLEEFEAVFGADEVPMPEAIPLLEDLLDDESDTQDLLARLSEYRLTEASSLDVLRRLNSGTREIYTTRRGKKFFEAIFATLLNVCSRVPYPDAALLHLEDFLRQSRSSTTYFEMLAEHPRTLDVLLNTAGHGEHLAILLEKHPEFIDQLFSPHTLGPQTEPIDHLGQLERQFRLFKNWERRLRAVRRHRQLEHLRLGVRFVLKLDDWKETSAALSQLARETIQAALDCLRKEAEIPKGLSVLGLGKLAINELNFFSDLDLVFIAKETNAETEQVVRQLIDLLGKHTADGIAYEVDTRLRPGGRTAPLLATADGLIKYFEHDADVWEFLAMTRACHVAGDENLSQQIFEGVGSAYNRFAGKFEATMDGEAGFVSSEVAKMRGRLEASVAKLPKWAKHSIKRGRGGIVDLEFARQYWAMRQVAEERLKLSHDQAAVLKAMESFIAENFKTSAENAKDSREDSNRANSKWEDNYCWLRQLEFTQRLLRGDDKDYLPQKAERLLPLTYALDQGYSSESLLEKAEAILRENRELFEQVLGITKNE